VADEAAELLALAAVNGAGFALMTAGEIQRADRGHVGPIGEAVCFFFASPATIRFMIASLQGHIPNV